MSSHVIIRGHVFDAREKAPFVASGVSLLGALEYNKSSDSVKCHECGVWVHGLGQHIKAHRLKRREYNAKHGLRLNGALSGMGSRRKHRISAKRQNKQGSGLAARYEGRATTKGRSPSPQSIEVQNEKSMCSAQLLFRLQVLAATHRRTPTRGDMREIGINPEAVRKRFGSMDNAMRLIGLAPNESGLTPNPTPQNFPIKSEIEKRWNERMPWPKEYFEVNPIEKRRA